MKKIYGIVVFVAVMMLGVSCKEAPSLSLSPESREIAAEGGSLEFTVKANYNWTAASDATWIRVGTPFGTKDESVLKITVSENGEPEARESTVTVTCEGITSQIRIRQGQKNMVVPADGNEVTVSCNAQTVEVQVSSNVDYSVDVSSSEPWVKVTGTKALKSSTVLLSVEENDRYTVRSATLLFTYQGQTIKQLYINQEGKPQTFKMVHVLQSIVAPVVSGFSMHGTILWGDGAQEEYNTPLSHIYAEEGEYEVVIEMSGAESISMPDIVGIEKVDLSSF